MSTVSKSAKPASRETGSGMERFNAIRPGTNAAYSTLFILLALLCRTTDRIRLERHHMRFSREELHHINRSLLPDT